MLRDDQIGRGIFICVDGLGELERVSDEFIKRYVTEKPPCKFVINKTKARVRIGFNLQLDHFTLRYLGVDVRHIPAAAKSLEIFRSKFEHTSDDKLTQAQFHLIFDGERYVITFQHVPKRKYSHLVLGKTKEISRGKSLRDRSLFPITIQVDALNWKVQLNYSYEENVFML